MPQPDGLEEYIESTEPGDNAYEIDISAAEWEADQRMRYPETATERKKYRIPCPDGVVGCAVAHYKWAECEPMCFANPQGFCVTCQRNMMQGK